MKRRLFILFVTVSLVLVAGTSAVLWVRSQFDYDFISRESWDAAGLNQRMVKAHLSEGQISFSCSLMHVPNYSSYIAVRGRPWWIYSVTGQPILGHGWYWVEHHLRSAFMVGPTSLGWTESWAAGCRLWVIGMISLLPLYWIAQGKFLGYHAFTQGVCPRCGYDLRATPHRCPECGMVVTNASVGSI